MTDDTGANTAHQSPMTSTRRGFMAAIPAVAAVTAVPAMAFTVTPRGAWDLAWQRYREAEAAMNTYAAEVFDPAFYSEVAFDKAHGAVSGRPGYWEQREAIVTKYGTSHRVPDALHDEMERLTEIYSDAETALMETPAPDAPAVRWKLDRLLEVDSLGSTPCWSREYVQQAVADYQRLLEAV